MKTKVPGRTYVSLSFSCPPELEGLTNQKAFFLGISRSEYLVNLVKRDLFENGAAIFSGQPPRIRRGGNTEKKTHS